MQSVLPLCICRDHFSLKLRGASEYAQVSQSTRHFTQTDYFFRSGEVPNNYFEVPAGIRNLLQIRLNSCCSVKVPSRAPHIRQTRTSCTRQAIGQSPGDSTADMLLPVGVTTYTEARSSSIADALLTIY